MQCGAHAQGCKFLTNIKINRGFNRLPELLLNQLEKLTVLGNKKQKIYRLQVATSNRNLRERQKGNTYIKAVSITQENFS